MYRSFITCDDPKGVVECKTIRKSKTGSHKLENFNKSCKMQKNLNPSTYKEERKEKISKENTEELHNPSSFQLMEVSKGADKLNRVIDSWSNGMKFDSHSKDIAKDLLKGALDLQESLVMLGKLQEASQYMAKLKRESKHSKGKSWDGKSDDTGSQRTASNRFGNRNYQMGFQEQRVSVDGSSRDCYEELREMIADSLTRQNLLPRSYSKDKGYNDGDFSSTSSSQSSVTQSHWFVSSDCSPSSSAPQKRSSGPNLIARLMGLEGISSKQVESEKISNPRRPFFDIDMPKVKRPQFGFQKVDPKRRTLEEILETMHFKGLLRSSSVEEFKSPSHHPNAFRFENTYTYDAEPIVVMKPLRFSCLEEEEEARTRMFSGEERALESKENPRKSKKIEALGHKEVKECKERHAKPEEKEVKTKEKVTSKIKASESVNHKAQKKEASEKKVEKTRKVISNRWKPVETENEKSKGISVSHIQAKVIPSQPNNPEKGSNIVKNWTKQKKIEPSSPITRSRTPTISHTSTDRKKKPKNGKSVKKPLAANIAAEKIECEDNTKEIKIVVKNERDMITTKSASVDQLFNDEERIDWEDDMKEIKIVIENECNLIRMNTASSVDQFFNKEEAGPHKIWDEEHCNENQYSTSELKQQTIQHESVVKSCEEEEANYSISQDIAKNKFFETKTTQKEVLLSSSLFLDRAEELFDINSNQPILSHTVSVDDSEEADIRLLLDCANELMELKSHRCSRTANLLLHTSVGGSRICISLDLLASEIWNGIEKLRSYSKLSSENLSVDNLFGVLERDLWCKGVGNGEWDLGWKDGYSLDEVELVVGDIEKLVFNSLLEEVITSIGL